MKKLLTVFALLFFITACQESTPDLDNNSNKAATQEGAESVETLDDFSGVSIVHNGVIYTVNESTPQIAAFAHRDGKIIATGDAQELRTNYPGAQELDANGSTIIPGFIDAHGHLLGLGQSLLHADLRGTKSKADIISVLKKHEADLISGQWLLGRGWDQNDWPEQELPTAADLDSAFPDRPVWLERIDGHANWANSTAMQAASKDLSGTWQPDGGEIVRDDKQKPSGVFIDNAVKLIAQFVPSASDAELIAALEKSMHKTASVGLTSMHDAGTTLKTWTLLKLLNQDKKLEVRVYAMADGAGDMLSQLCKNGPIIDPEARLTARAVKLYSDGALGSRGAALLADYSDAPNNVGLLIESEETLSRHSQRASACGLQVNIHAIGDRGNQTTLNVLESIQDDNNPGRHRIEHSQVVAPDDFQRFKDLKLVASVQPTHATSDMYWAEERVGPERIKGAYVWQSFIEMGVPLALGSDFPVEKPDPLLGFYAAISRQDAKGWPEDGWYSKERLDRKQALYGFTLGAAYAAFQEGQLGSLEVGKYADFVLLSKDIMQVPTNEILTTEIVATYINGEAVFHQKDK